MPVVEAMGSFSAPLLVAVSIGLSIGLCFIGRLVLYRLVLYRLVVDWLCALGFIDRLCALSTALSMACALSAALLMALVLYRWLVLYRRRL